jgi:ankyrin repeat protein
VVELAKALIQRVAKPGGVDLPRGNRPILDAARYRPEGVALLIEAGDSLLERGRYSPLMVAIAESQADVVELLLKASVVKTYR